MNCIRCGREIGEDQSFCQNCLGEMEDYPVKPGTVVLIPKRTEVQEEKKAPVRRKPSLSAEERVVKLKKKVLWLRLTVATLLLVSGLLAFAIGEAAVKLDFYRFLGQNYNTVESAGPATRNPG